MVLIATLTIVGGWNSYTISLSLQDPIVFIEKEERKTDCLSLSLTPHPQETYHLLRPYDPEGILGSLNSIILCFLGVQAGRILVLYKNDYNIIIRFLLWGLLLVG